MVSAPGGLLISGGSVIVGDGTARSGPTDVYLEGDLIVAVGDDARSLADAAGQSARLRCASRRFANAGVSAGFLATASAKARAAAG